MFTDYLAGYGRVKPGWCFYFRDDPKFLMIPAPTIACHLIPLRRRMTLSCAVQKVLQYQQVRNQTKHNAVLKVNGKVAKN